MRGGVEGDHLLAKGGLFVWNGKKEMGAYGGKGGKEKQ